MELIKACMYVRYDPDVSSDRAKLARLLKEYGIYFECDLFDHAHIVIDTVKLHGSSNSIGRTCRIDDSIRARAKQMREEGMTLRQIAVELSISIGSAFNFTKDL